MNNSIDILLATYNGERYLDQQIVSIIEQVNSDWRLLVRDDGSTDATMQILSKYIQSYPEKIKLINDNLGRLGPAQSFDKLLQHSDAPYVSFCDQDDVWLPEKLQLLVEAVQHEEKTYGAEMPVLVHSDLHVVDNELGSLADSFWKYQKLNPLKMQSLERLLVQNCVTGCATMVNRSLVNCALPVPRDVIMHDWWFALLAASQGRIEHLNVKTLKYRQHASNDTGAKKWGMNFILKAMFQRRKHYQDNLLKTRSQAKMLIEHGNLDDKNLRVVSRYVNLFDCGWFRRRLEILRMGFLKYGLIRNIALMLWV